MSEQYKPIPDWKDAPAWANWRAVDESGALFYYFRKPVLGSIAWQAVSTYGLCFRDCDPTNWRESLEARPEKITPENLQT